MSTPELQNLKDAATSTALRRLLFAFFALPSAALCAVAPFPSGLVFNLHVFGPTQPLGPPLYFAIALCIGLYQEGPISAADVLKILIGIILSWTAAYQIAYFSGMGLTNADSWMPARFSPQGAFMKIYFAAIAGFIAGAVGGLGTSVTIAAVRMSVRHRSFFVRTAAVGAAAGVLLQINGHPSFPDHLMLFLVWQPAVAWSVARDLIESKDKSEAVAQP